MKAAVLKEIGKPFAIEDVPVPRIGADEVLVETRTCGICRTDLHIQDGLAYVPNLPHIPGHEPAGVVAAVGKNVGHIKVGQRVVPHLFVRSRECAYTRAGMDAQAMHLSGIIGVTLPGGFAEYFAAPAANLLTLPEAIPFDAGGLVSCAVITAVHAFRLAKLQKNDAALVLGAGGIGLVLVQLLRAAGVRTIAVARSQASLDLAEKGVRNLLCEAPFGPSRKKVPDTFFLSVRSDVPDIAEQIRQFVGTDRDGVHCVFEMVGTAATMKLAAECVMRCGKIIVIGEEPEFPAIDTVQIAQRELQIIGSRNGSLQDAIDAIDTMAAGIIQPPIARRYPLDRFNEAIEHVRSGASHGRIVIQVKE